jgi:hypothetical protein
MGMEYRGQVIPAGHCIVLQLIIDDVTYDLSMARKYIISLEKDNNTGKVLEYNPSCIPWGIPVSPCKC